MLTLFVQTEALDGGTRGRKSWRRVRVQRARGRSLGPGVAAGAEITPDNEAAAVAGDNVEIAVGVDVTNRDGGNRVAGTNHRAPLVGAADVDQRAATGELDEPNRRRRMRPVVTGRRRRGRRDRGQRQQGGDERLDEPAHQLEDSLLAA